MWGEYGRMDKKVFLGMCEIVLDDLNLRSIVFGWYKLFGMIAATAQHQRAGGGSGKSGQKDHNKQKPTGSRSESRKGRAGGANSN